MAIEGIIDEDAGAEVPPQADVIEKAHHNGLDESKVDPRAANGSVHERLRVCEGKGVARHGGQVAAGAVQAHPCAVEGKEWFEDGEDEAKGKRYSNRGRNDGIIRHCNGFSKTAQSSFFNRDSVSEGRVCKVKKQVIRVALNSIVRINPTVASWQLAPGANTLLFNQPCFFFSIYYKM